MAGGRIARRLGGPEQRRRRHLRFAVVGAVLLAVALVLVIVGDEDPTTEATEEVDDLDRQALAAADGPVEVCTVSNAQLATLYNALLRDNDSPTAAVEFLGGPFVDMARLRAEALRNLDGGDELDALVDELEAVIDGIEADPAAAVDVNPFEDLNARWRDAGLAACAIDPTTVPGDA